VSTPGVETVRGWLGRVMVDRDGNRLGEITDIYLDRETERPEWAVVRTGLFGTRSTFVPLAEAAEAGDQIQVPHERTAVKAAPNIEAEGQLSEAEEAELYRHYGLDYDAVTADDRDTAAGSPTADQPETQVDSTPPGNAVTPSAEPAGPADFPVGEGVSRPFVYETPGPVEERPGGRRREPGQVRLRRYLVTEVVTETQTGQRHEVRVEAEPVNHQDVPNLAATSDPEDAPARRGPPEPDPNDWFRAEDDPRR
jgi:sporulation protein YlmC with PRC-barrel domain